MKQTYESQWDECLKIVRDNIQNEEAYQSFFACCHAHSFEEAECRLTLAIPSAFVREQLESQYFDLLKKTLQRVYGPKIRLRYISYVAETKVGLGTQPAVAQAQAFDTHLNPQLTFESFCSGRSNELALSAARTVAAQPGHNAFNPFFIFGASGVGKTHLAQAIGLKILETMPTKRVLYVTAHLFQVQYTDAVRRNLFNDFINFYQTIDVLIVDDIQEFAGKTKVATQNAFFHIFNYLQQSGKQLVMTCDRPPVELEDLVPRLLTRFKWGFIGEIEHPDYDLRCQILHGKCEKEGLDIADDVIRFIAKNATDNVRDLEGVINSLLAYSITFNRPIDQDLAARVLKMIVKVEARVVTIESILTLVAQFFGVDQKSILSKSRRKDFVLARQASMALCKKYTTQSVSHIGQVIGDRDHATVLHALKSVENLLDTDNAFKAKYQEVEKAISNC